MTSLNYCEGQIVQNGARMGDRLIIKPFRGNIKRIPLKRTKYILNAHFDPCGVYQKGICLLLPSLKGDGIDLELRYGDIENPKTKSKISTYFLRSLNNPFRINGTITYNAYLGRGDQLDIGPNRIQVEREGGACEKEVSLPLEKEAVESHFNILIEGETGVGKTRLAREIHQQSKRVGPFIHINIASYPSTLVEAEIFGHVKGAFTGANRDKRGALELAHKGTLFIDELDSLPIDLQTKLLLFLDHKKFRRVGDANEKQLDVRFIFASGKNLRECIQNEEMRRDFYFRISSGFKVFLSPLRENPRKILEYVEAFELKYGITVDPKLKGLYCKYTWPGNYRQLEYHLEKKKILNQGAYWKFDQVDEELLENRSHIQIKKGMSLQTMKTYYAFNTFHRTHGDTALTCKILGITSATLKSLLNQFERESSQQEYF